MARKPPSFRQPTLEFQPDQVEVPAPQDPALTHPEGNQHAVQNDHPPISPATSGNLQPTQERPNLASDPGRLRTRPENQTRGLEGGIGQGESEQRSEPAGERSPGDRASAVDEYFAPQRVAER